MLNIFYSLICIRISEVMNPSYPKYIHMYMYTGRTFFLLYVPRLYGFESYGGHGGLGSEFFFSFHFKPVNSPIVSKSIMEVFSSILIYPCVVEVKVVYTWHQGRPQSTSRYF